MEHDRQLLHILQTLNKKGLTLRKEKCSFGQQQVKWFDNIYSKVGMSPDHEKCKVIREWPESKSCAEVKSFLHTIKP